jgi:hypothetical protein
MPYDNSLKKVLLRKGKLFPSNQAIAIAIGTMTFSAVASFLS